jgi:hypothetical protein
MSNQPQAHVADERELPPLPAQEYLGGDESFGDAVYGYTGEQMLNFVLADRAARAASAAIPAGANELSTLKPFAYCIIDGYDREYNTIDEFSGGRSNGVELYAAAQVQAILNERIAAGAPAEMPKPMASDLPGEAWVTPLRYGSQVTFYKPKKPHDWDDDEEKWYCYPLVRAAQPAPAPATDAEVDTHLDAILRASGSALRHYSMPKTVSDMRSAFRAAMLSANSPREAG